MQNRVTRRHVLKTTTLAGAGALLSAGRVWGYGQSPNGRLAFAGIGVGGRGAADVKGAAAAGANCIALCDVDEARSAGTLKAFPKAKKYKDFRRMLGEIDKQIDAVVIGTPDHCHAPPAAMAMKMGKHCYCEKPLTRTVHEARTLQELATKNRLVTQLGTQIHAGDNYRRVVELVQSGAIGPVAEVHVWCGARYSGGDRPKDTPPVPPTLDWDLWLGPAPYRPYNPAYVPFKWRGWWDFATGGLGDFFCHYTDLPYWALGLKYPTHVVSEGSQPVHPESCHQWMIVRFQFPARGERPPVKLTWYDGGKKPDFAALEKKLGGAKIPAWGSAVLFVGTKGMLLADYGRRVLLPESKYANFKAPAPTIPNSIGHHKEWVEACKTGGPTTCNFAYSGPLTESALLGAVSYRTSSPLEWDAEKLKATNCPAADRFIHREYRKGWTL